VNLGRNKRWKNPSTSLWLRNLIDQIFIHEQLGISSGVVDVANATYEEAKITLRKIPRPHAFVEDEHWSVVRMKKEFHARFVTILQII
jgi:hypothetical protein